MECPLKEVHFTVNTNQKFSVTVLVIKLMNLQYNMEVAIGFQGVGLTVLIFQVNRLI